MDLLIEFLNIIAIVIGYTTIIIAFAFSFIRTIYLIRHRPCKETRYAEEWLKKNYQEVMTFQEFSENYNECEACKEFYYSESNHCCKNK